MRFPLNFEEWWKTFVELERLYPRILPLTLWRAWELAFYRHYQLPEPVLDVGCGDGRFFRQIWSPVPRADGVDLSPQAVTLARQEQVYQRVFCAPAHALPLPTGTYAAVFSNCALEHMDHIDRVLAEMARVTCSGGRLLFSVVTDRLVVWAPLRRLAATLGETQRGEALWQAYADFHHLVNPFTRAVWEEKIEQVGFRVLESWPIVPEPFARFFLFLDELWHVKSSSNGEVGEVLRRYLLGLPRYEEGLYRILQGLWVLEPPTAQGEGAGLIVWAERM